MADRTNDAADATGSTGAGSSTPSLEDLQHWTGVIGRAQQMMLEHGLRRPDDALGMPDLSAVPDITALFAGWPATARIDADALAAAQGDFWRGTIDLWQRFLDPAAPPPQAPGDARFAAPEWRDHPAFALLRDGYVLAADAIMRQVEAVEGISDRQRETLRFAARRFVEAASPSNFLATNPQALTRMIETRGESALKGLENMLRDLGRGQLTHTPETAFELGKDLAATPGKVIHETKLYQLIQYSPTTDEVETVPLVIFPPWINRFYVLDLGPKKSFVRWAVAQGMTVFMVSWRSADAETADTTLDDYVAAQIEAVDVVRALLGVERAHVIGYCVAGTVLAATLALLAARGEDGKIASATFFTAQVDFEKAGDLSLLVDDPTLGAVTALSADTGTVDGRYLAAVFNLLRGRELIWNYVTNNYLLGEDYRAFDLLHWNGDVVNLPGGWHRDYLRDFYRDNLLVKPGAISVMGTPIDLTRVTTPTYVQAGREDHIAPAESVWKMTDHFRGPVRFLLAGSGHIAGVVNPPDAEKYQYWISDEPAGTLEDFIASAAEVRGSWWPHWRTWIGERSDGRTAAEGARIPGAGALPAIEDAPGRYVRTR